MNSIIQPISEMDREKIIVIVGIVISVLVLAALIGFIGQGNVREIPLYIQRKLNKL